MWERPRRPFSLLLTSQVTLDALQSLSRSGALSRTILNLHGSRWRPTVFSAQHRATPKSEEGEPPS